MVQIRHMKSLPKSSLAACLTETATLMEMMMHPLLMHVVEYLLYTIHYTTSIILRAYH